MTCHLRAPVSRCVRAVATVVAIVAGVMSLPGGSAGAVPYPDNQWASFRSGATPGMALAITGADGTLIRCTSAFAARDEDNTPLVLTAGHCFPAGARSYAEYGVITGSAGKVRLDRLGTVDTAQSRTTPAARRTVEWVTDFAVIRVDPSVAPVATIADTYAVSEVATADRLTRGMTVCKYGYRTQETCGPVVAVEDGFVRVNLYSRTGDSGAPAYLKLGGNTVAAVGLLSSSPKMGTFTDDYVTDFALLAPILSQMRINLSR